MSYMTNCTGNVGSAYDSSRTCAHNCISKDEHEYYLRPFFRRNYLNDFICVKHFKEFREYLPCYRNRRSLEFFFVKCGYFALDDTSVLQATKRTCTALNCVLHYIPGLIRHDCGVSSYDSKFAKKAGDLMERMVAAFLRERVKLNKMIRMCEDMK
uniref:DB domain-containing protein n=1 Tax=Heterorhabditis bacteriophora TaxID=37862 RepID=A0A1I7X1V1_HETBA